jgi:hypothetical protein
MTAVAIAASIFTCPHGLPMTVSASQQLLTVDGQSVVVQSDLLGATFTCASSSNTPCTAVVSIDGGLSTTLTVGGEPVVLATVTGTTTGAPATPVQITSVNQSKLEAA